MKILKKILLIIVGFILSCAVLAGALILASPLVSREPIPEEVPETLSFSILYPESSSLSDYISDFAARWSADVYCDIELRSYASDDELTEMLKLSAPDLLVCSGGLSFSLSEQGLLSSAGNEIIDFSAPFTACSPSVGDSYFPIGAVCDVLAVNSQRLQDIPAYTGAEQFSSLESLLSLASDYAAEGNGPFFSADSFSNLFFSCMYGKDVSISAVKAEDMLKDGYVDFYNLLAECFMSGGISPRSDTSCSELLQLGQLPAAILSSTEAALLPTEYELYPLPSYSGSVPSSYAELTGFSVTCRDPENISLIYSFLSAFFTDPDYYDVVLSLGYLPGTASSSADNSRPLSSAFEALSANGRLIVPELNGDFTMNRAAFEEQFRQSVTLLCN